MNRKKETKEKTSHTESDKSKEFIDIALGRMSFNLSKYVEALKERAGSISSREMCRRCNISMAVLSDIIGHKYVPKMEVILKLAYGMNVDIAKMLDNLWDVEDARAWSKITNTPLSEYIIERKGNHVNVANNLTLDEMLAKEGLTKNDVKEVLEFIAFKKSRQKRR